MNEVTELIELLDSNKEITKQDLMHIREIFTTCNCEQDHLWQQIGEPETGSCYNYGSNGDGYYRHPESSFAVKIRYKKISYECQKCGQKREETRRNN